MTTREATAAAMNGAIANVREATEVAIRVAARLPTSEARVTWRRALADVLNEMARRARSEDP